MHDEIDIHAFISYLLSHKYNTYIQLYISICPSMMYISKSHHISKAKHVLFIYLNFFFVRGALIEPPLDWKKAQNVLWIGRSNNIIYIFFLKIWFSPSWLHRKATDSNKCHKKIFSNTDAACWSLLGIQVTILETINLSPR